MRTNSHCLLLTCFFLAVPLHARAQQAPALLPQSNSQSDSSGSAQDPGNGPAIDPDNRPLSGAQDLTPGIPESAKNGLDASISVQQRVDAATGSNNYRWYAENDALGTVLWNHAWHQNTLLLRYNGGTLFDGGTYFQSIHTFAMLQSFIFGRWSLQVSDQAIYAPESPFGLPGLELLSTNFFGTNPTLLANQTVFTGQTTRLSNSAIGQLEYAISRRTALTVAGFHSLLHYTATSLADNTQAGGRLGYDYALTARDTVALTYGYQQLEFNFLNSKMDINSATLSYAHQVLGRFSLQMEGGAQLAHSFGPMSPPRTNVLPEARFVLTSDWRRTRFSLSASKSLMSGGGLSVATNTTTASLSADRNLSRTWTSTINVGYAGNSLIGLNYKIKSGFVGATLEKTMGQHIRLSLLYNFQQQAADNVCTFSLCAGEYSRHSVGAGVKWQFRPIGLR